VVDLFYDEFERVYPNKARGVRVKQAGQQDEEEVVIDDEDTRIAGVSCPNWRRSSRECSRQTPS
jgi:hypothetical protein